MVLILEGFNLVETLVKNRPFPQENTHSDNFLTWFLNLEYLPSPGASKSTFLPTPKASFPVPQVKNPYPRGTGYLSRTQRGGCGQVFSLPDEPRARAS